MEPNENIYSTIYNGSFSHGVDEKRRVQIPALWRPEASGIDFTLITWPEHREGTCLRVLPPHEMIALIRKLGAMANSDPRKTVLMRYIGARSIQVTLDKAGRICIPEKFANEAGITKEVILVGLLTVFEIWSPERYLKVDLSDSGAVQGGIPFIP